MGDKVRQWISKLALGAPIGRFLSDSRLEKSLEAARELKSPPNLDGQRSF